MTYADSILINPVAVSNLKSNIILFLLATTLAQHFKKYFDFVEQALVIVNNNKNHHVEDFTRRSSLVELNVH